MKFVFINIDFSSNGNKHSAHEFEGAWSKDDISYEDENDSKWKSGKDWIRSMKILFSKDLLDEFIVLFIFSLRV